MLKDKKKRKEVSRTGTIKVGRRKVKIKGKKILQPDIILSYPEDSRVYMFCIVLELDCSSDIAIVLLIFILL